MTTERSSCLAFAAVRVATVSPRTPRMREGPSPPPRTWLAETHDSSSESDDNEKLTSFFTVSQYSFVQTFGSCTSRGAASVDTCIRMGSDVGKRSIRGAGWRVRGMARSVYVRLATDRRFAVRVVGLLIVLLVGGSFAMKAVVGTVEHLRGVHVGPPTQHCGSSKYGFIRSNSCHPFSLPHKMGRVDVHPKQCGKFSATTAGFCLCDDDDERTTIAAPKGCGTEPVMCEKACAERPIVAKKLPKCDEQGDDSKECLNRDQSDAIQLPSMQIKKTVNELAKAMGDPLGVAMPPGSRRDLYTDFTMYGRRIGSDAVKEVRRRVDLFKRTAPAYPSFTFTGKGIVIVGGNNQKFQTSYWVAIHAMRRTGCVLPVQLWFPEGEAPGCAHNAELKKMGVTVHSFHELLDQKSSHASSAAMSNRFMYKIVALAFSSFEEVLLMDSDNIVLSDPSSLFASEVYMKNGSVLWMDFWRGSSAPDLQQVLGHGVKSKHTHESGQMLIDKKKTWEALRLALFMNAHSDVFYPLTVNYMGLGDKEIVAAAFLHLGIPYGLSPKGPDHVGVRDHDRSETLGNTMMQHDMNGVPMFLHANLGKPMGFVPAEESSYVRRWQISNEHGLDLPKVINEAAGVNDFEMWYYSLIKKYRCWFDSRPAKHWYHTLGFGPFLEGFHISDHYNVNDELESFQGMKRAGIVFG